MFQDLPQSQKNKYLKILAILFTTSELQGNWYINLNLWPYIVSGIWMNFQPSICFCIFVSVSWPIYKIYQYLTVPMPITQIRDTNIIKKLDNFSTMSQKGGAQKTTKLSEMRTFENQWRGVSIFQKSLNYNLLSDPIQKKKN